MILLRPVRDRQIHIFKILPLTIMKTLMKNIQCLLLFLVLISCSSSNDTPNELTTQDLVIPLNFSSEINLNVQNQTASIDWSSVTNAQSYVLSIFQSSTTYEQSQQTKFTIDELESDELFQWYLDITIYACVKIIDLNDSLQLSTYCRTAGRIIDNQAQTSNNPFIKTPFP